MSPKDGSAVPVSPWRERIAQIRDEEVAFGTTRFLPAYEDIPVEFKRQNGTIWNTLFSLWFFGGLKTLQLTPKEGVDVNLAMRCIGAHMRSWESRHEHKEAGVAYMMSCLFENATWTT